MFGIGFGELIIIAIVCLLVFDPKDLPQVFKKIAQFYQQITKLKEEVNFKISLTKDDKGNKGE
jgi:Sec-independent protein translocase protein TatA